MAWDSPEFTQYLMLQRRWRPATVLAMKRRLRWCEKLGLNLEPMRLEDATKFLASQLLMGHGENSYNITVRALKALGGFQGLDMKIVRAQPPPRKKYRSLTPAQVHACLTFRHPNKRTEQMRRALLLLMLKTGLRSGELARLRVSDLDVKTSPPRIHVRAPTKRGAKRWIPVEPWVLSPKRAVGAYLASRPDPPGDSDAFWVCTVNNQGKPCKPKTYTVNGIQQVIRETSAQLGFQLNCTIARHTRATELRGRGWDLLALKEYLGHSSVKSTEIYAEVNEEDLSRTMRSMGSKDPWTGRPNP